MAWIAAGEGEPPAIALTDPIRATGEAVRGDIILPTGEGMLRKAGCAMLISPASAYYSARSMMLLANSAVISEAAGSPAWKRALEPNSWQFSDLWSAFPEFANSIVLWPHPIMEQNHV